MIFGTQDKDFFPADFPAKFKAMKAMGFDAFEVDGKVLVENTAALGAAARDAGVAVTSACGGYRGWIGDFIEERRLNGVEDLKAIIRALAQVGGRGVVVPAAWGMFTYRLPPMTSPRSVEGDKKAILASLAALDPVAAEHGVTLYLEPLNRYQDHMINTLQDARDILEAGGFQNVAIVGDFYHMSIEEDDISQSLERHAPYVKHLHVAENHRYQPGTGSIDFKRHFATLKRLGYTGACVYEGRVRADDPLAAYADSIRYLRDAYETA